MKKENRLKKNEEFQIVFQQGSSVANRQFVIYKLKRSDQLNNRIGLSVSKKLGNAVIRNRIKRLMREGLREIIPHINGTYDLVVIARKPVSEMDMQSITKSLRHVFRQGKLIK